METSAQLLRCNYNVTLAGGQSRVFDVVRNLLFCLRFVMPLVN